MSFRNDLSYRSILYRSDTRDPYTDIFINGFKARTPYSNDWWLHAIRYDEEKALHKDVNEDYAVCTSTSFETCAIFPFISNENSYIYIMVNKVPEKISIDHKQTGKFKYSVSNGSREVDFSTPIDMHSLQTEEIGVKIEEKMAKNPLAYDDHLGIYLGVTLYGYEVFTGEVSPDKIFCAVKISPNEPEWYPISCDPFEKMTMPYRSFKIIDVYFNENFQEKDTATTVQILATLVKLKKKKILHTPHPLSGLGGKTLPSPLKHSMEKVFDIDPLLLNSYIQSNLLSHSLFSRQLLSFGTNAQEITENLKKETTQKIESE